MRFVRPNTWLGIECSQFGERERDYNAVFLIHEQSIEEDVGGREDIAFLWAMLAVTIVS